MMNIILDLIVVAIIVLFVVLSAKKGFVRTLIEVVGFILAAVLASSFSAPITTAICDNTIKPIVEEATVSALEDTATSNITDAAENIWDSLPGFVVNAAESSGITKNSVGEHISSSTTQTLDGVVDGLVNNVFMPIIFNIVKIIITFVLFVALVIISMIVARLINKLFSGAVLGKLNRALGGLLGAVKGSAFAAIFCLLISLLAGLSKSGFLNITTETIDSTYIVSEILNLLSL